MNKTFKTVKASLIMGIVLLSVIFVISPTTTVSAKVERPKLFSFPSYVRLDIDTSPLNEDLEIDKAINVPVDIYYSTDIPENFLWFLPWQLKNIFLFGAVVVPKQKLHVEVLNPPDWADVGILTPDLNVDIPAGDTNLPPVSTTLVISPREEAPAVPHTITIRVTTETFGRVLGLTYDQLVTFTPSFVPTIEIKVDNPIREAGPHQSVTYIISVENLGNKKARVYPDLQTGDSRWVPTINPPHLDVDPGRKGEFTFSVFTPYDFGWHNEIGDFKINFTYKIFPIRAGSPEGGPDIISLSVTNYGFSTPGFEVLPFLFAALIVIVLYTKKRHSK